MQPWPNAYDFQTLLKHFFELRPLRGQHHKKLHQLVEDHARTILSHPDVRYVPAFKVFDLLSGMVNHAALIDEDHHLRETEASKLLEAEFSPAAPLLRSFMLEAALERARYEPLMMVGEFADAQEHRSSLLEKRWQAMREAHSDTHALPTEWLNVVDEAVQRVITSKTFRNYRVGPLLQMFAEMLESARQMYTTNAPITSLAGKIGDKSALWKRYKLKVNRFRETEEAAHFDTIPTDALHFPKHLQ